MISSLGTRDSSDKRDWPPSDDDASESEPLGPRKIYKTLSRHKDLQSYRAATALAKFVDSTSESEVDPHRIPISSLKLLN